MEIRPNCVCTTYYGAGALADYEWKILKAARRGDVNFFTKLEEKIGDKEELRLRCERANSDRGITAIHYAATKGWLEICKFLIENAGVDINIESENETRALMAAVEHGHKELAEYLISRGAWIDASNYELKTALHFAVSHENREIIELLVSNGANVNAETRGGKTALDIAALNARVESIQLLLDNGAQPNYTALVSAITGGSPECLEVLLKSGADPNGDGLGIGKRPLTYALESGELQVIKLLLDAGANPNGDGLGKTPLAYAAESGELQVIKLLLEAKANPNAFCKCGLKAIEHAAKAEKREAVELLFPETMEIRGIILDWNVDGIMEYHSFSDENAC